MLPLIKEWCKCYLSGVVAWYLRSRWSITSFNLYDVGSMLFCTQIGDFLIWVSQDWMYWFRSCVFVAGSTWSIYFAHVNIHTSSGNCAHCLLSGNSCEIFFCIVLNMLQGFYCSLFKWSLPCNWLAYDCMSSLHVMDMDTKCPDSMLDYVMWTVVWGEKMGKPKGKPTLCVLNQLEMTYRNFCKMSEIHGNGSGSTV